MAFQIRISTTALFEAAEVCKNAQRSAAQSKNLLSRQYTVLDQAWDGNASQAGLSMLQQFRRTADALEDIAVLCGRRVREIAHRFATLDENVGSDGQSAENVRMMFIHACEIPIPSGAHSAAVSGEFRIDTRQVRQVVRECNNISHDYEDVVRMLRTMLRNLEANWEGRAFARFESDCNRMITCYSRMANALNRFSDSLNTSVMQYEEMDLQMRNRFQQGK